MNQSSPGRSRALPATLRWPLALAFGVLAFAAVLQITDPPLPGLDPDAVSYLGGAESLIARHEFRTPTAHWWSADSTQPLSHFPPGFSTAIAMPMALGMPPVQAARLANALAAFVMMTTLVLLVIDASSALMGALTAMAIFAMSAMLEVHVSVLSEPIFLACMALMLAAMVRRPNAPLASGIPAALGMIVRYAGASLVAAAVLWSAARRGTLAQRGGRALVAALPALLLQGSWVLRTRRVAPTESIRELSYYGDLRPTFAEGARTIEAWLVPDPNAWRAPLPHRGLLTAVVLAIVVCIVVAGVRAIREGHPRAERATALVAASALIVACYLGVIVFSRIFADAQIPFDQRILSPMLLLATIVTAVSAFHWWRSSRATRSRMALIGAATVWWFAAALVTWRQQRDLRALGSDFDRPRWSRSALIAYASAEGATHPLYTNWPAAVYFHLHRPARDVPILEESDRMDEFADSVRTHDGRVLMFALPGTSNVTVDSLRRVRGLRIVLEGRGGAVFAPAPRETTPALPPTVAPPYPPR